MRLMHILLLGLLALRSANLAWAQEERKMADVLVYGATPAGIASAIAAGSFLSLCPVILEQRHNPFLRLLRQTRNTACKQ